MLSDSENYSWHNSDEPFTYEDVLKENEQINKNIDKHMFWKEVEKICIETGGVRKESDYVK